MVVLASCSQGEAPRLGIEKPHLDAVFPAVLLPGSTMVLEGKGFATGGLGSTRVAVRGVRDDGTLLAEMWLPVDTIDDGRLEVVVDRTLWERLGTGRLSLQILAVTVIAGEESLSEPIELMVDVVEYLDPGLPSLSIPDLVFVNDELMITGSRLLLGGAEGQSLVTIDGCVSRDGECQPITAAQVPLHPLGEFDRDAGTFAWRPELAGIRAGEFRGTIAVQNHHPDDTIRASEARGFDLELRESAVFGPGRVAASLGQYIDIEGAGFVESSERGDTLIR